MGADGNYQVPVTRVQFEATISEDEIDLDTGFLMMPQTLPVSAAIPTAGVVEPPGEGMTGTGPAAGSAPGISGPSGTAPSGSPIAQKTVEISFSADRNQLFTAWNAIANLADLAGRVNLTVRADSALGFDGTKLQNGVLEPLRESDLID
jgi:hypothetical protein